MNHYESGQRYGRLVILEIISHPKNPKAKCKCDCGRITVTQIGALGNGHTKSCGCLSKELKRNYKHGLSKTSTYKIYHGILKRCNDMRHKSYPNYGGRGIKCEWESFEQFLKDMGPHKKGYWVERIDNNGDYSGKNCRWVKPIENLQNKRTSKYWFVRGKKFSNSRLAAEYFGVDQSHINRMCNGYTKHGIYHPPKPGCKVEYKYA